MSLNTSFTAQGRKHGVTDEQFPFDNSLLQGRFEKSQFYRGRLSSNLRDAGNTDNTSIIRKGALLAYTSGTDKELTHFDPTGAVSNGSHRFAALLGRSINLLDSTGTATDRQVGDILGGGVISPNDVLLVSQSSPGIVGNAYEYHIRKQMAANGDFVFEDHPNECPLMSWSHSDAKTASATLVESDRDILWTNSGASGSVTLTLPTTPKKDLAFYFHVIADQNLVVTSTTTDVIAFNNAAATSVAFQTSSEKIGGGFAVIGNGSKWQVINMSAGANTVTVA